MRRHARPPTIPAAPQLVVHGHVRLRGRRVDRPGFTLDIGDDRALGERARRMPDVRAAVARGPEVRLPGYLAPEAGGYRGARRRAAGAAGRPVHRGRGAIAEL